MCIPAFLHVSVSISLASVSRWVRLPATLREMSPRKRTQPDPREAEIEPSFEAAPRDKTFTRTNRTRHVPLRRRQRLILAEYAKLNASSLSFPQKSVGRNAKQVKRVSVTCERRSVMPRSASGIISRTSHSQSRSDAYLS